MLFLLAGGVLSCARARSEPLRAGERDRSAGASVPLVSQRSDFEKRVLLTGEVDVVSATELRVPRLQSYRAPIRWLVESESLEVKKGQKIAEVDSATLSGQLRERTLMLAEAEVEVQRQQWQGALAEADLQLEVDRKRAAQKRAEIDADLPPNILPKRDFLEKQLALKRAQADLDRAAEALKAQRKTGHVELDLRRLALQKAEREVRWAEQSIASLTIRAPADGLLIVGDHPEGRKYQVGDEVQTGVAIARMPDQTSLRIRAFLSDVDDGRIEVGMPAIVTLDAYPDRELPGNVTQISPVAVEFSEKSPRRMFRVAVDLDDAGETLLRPGLSARIEVIAARLASKVLIPRVTLDFSALPYRARLANGNSIEVVTGGCNAVMCVAEGGLAPGKALARAFP